VAAAALTRTAEYYGSSNLPVLTKERATGLRLLGTDGPFAVGSGPLVTGPTLALMMAMADRAASCGELDGDGVDILGDRAPTAAIYVFHDRPGRRRLG
jgi:hypothetical protein